MENLRSLIKPLVSKASWRRYRGPFAISSDFSRFVFSPRILSSISTIRKRWKFTRDLGGTQTRLARWIKMRNWTSHRCASSDSRAAARRKSGNRTDREKKHKEHVRISKPGGRVIIMRYTFTRSLSGSDNLSDVQLISATVNPISCTD